MESRSWVRLEVRMDLPTTTPETRSERLAALEDDIRRRLWAREREGNARAFGELQYLTSNGAKVSSYNSLQDALNVSLANSRLVRLGAMRADISGRLCRVTQGMPGDVFDALINDMAVLQDKYEQRKLLDGL